MKTAAYSKTLLSFWSPQMRISVVDLSVSTSSTRFCSVTVWFLHNTLYKYLQTYSFVLFSASTSKIGCVFQPKLKDDQWEKQVMFYIEFL